MAAPLARLSGAIAARVAPAPASADVGSVLLCCIYRARNAPFVARMAVEVEALGGEVRLWALDEVDSRLERWTVGTGPGAKFPLLNRLAAGVDLGSLGWAVFADDDFVFVGGSLHELLATADRAGLDFVQPAHTELSHRELEFTVRRPAVRARWTTFVEIGPVFAVRRPWIDRIVPFPGAHTMGWGLELEWSDLAAEGMRLGIVDAVPIRHLAAVGTGYAKQEQRDRLQVLLDARGLESVHEIQRVVDVWRPWQRRAAWLRSGNRDRPTPATR